MGEFEGMKNLVKIYTGKREKCHEDELELMVCANQKCEITDLDAPIPTFYSYKQANDEGWVFTEDPRYKDPYTSEPGPVAVCPSCASKHKWSD